MTPAVLDADQQHRFIARLAGAGSLLNELRSLLASVAVSCLVSWTVFALCWMSVARAGLTPGLMVVQFAAAALAALAAGFAYLATRGDYSSSMSEKRSFLGCSSGFFWPGACGVCEPGCAGRCGVCAAAAGWAGWGACPVRAGCPTRAGVASSW